MCALVIGCFALATCMGLVMCIACWIMCRTIGAVHAGQVCTCDATVLLQRFLRSVPPQCCSQGSQSA